MHTHAQTNIRATYISIYIYTYVHVHIYIKKYMYIYTDIHTQIRMYTYLAHDGIVTLREAAREDAHHVCGRKLDGCLCFKYLPASECARKCVCVCARVHVSLCIETE